MQQKKKNYFKFKKKKAHTYNNKQQHAYSFPIFFSPFIGDGDFFIIFYFVP